MTRDTILVFEQTKTRKRAAGWRYRFWKAGEAEPLFTSEWLFPTREAAAATALKFNDQCYAGAYKLRARKGAR